MCACACPNDRNRLENERKRASSERLRHSRRRHCQTLKMKHATCWGASKLFLYTNTHRWRVQIAIYKGWYWTRNKQQNAKKHRDISVFLGTYFSLHISTDLLQTEKYLIIKTTGKYPTSQNEHMKKRVFATCFAKLSNCFGLATILITLVILSNLSEVQKIKYMENSGIKIHPICSRNTLVCIQNNCNFTYENNTIT